MTTNGFPEPELDDLYRELILDHYRHPRNKGIAEGADVDLHQNNPLCGDEIVLYLDLDGNSGTVNDVRIGGQRDGDGEPWYVARKDIEHNRLIVVQGHEHPALFRDELSATDLSWTSGSAPHCQWVYAAKTRYRQKDAPCSIARIENDRCLIEFAEPQWAVTAGQSVVVYESRVCLGGGIIEG